MIKKIWMTLAVCLVGLAAWAQDVAVTFHTNLYDLQGETNVFTFYMGASKDTYFDVDCGFGPVEVEVGVAEYDPESTGINGTPVTCTVSSKGDVTIYGDASLLDYLDMEGCYIKSIDLSRAVNLDYLNLKHNEIEGLDLSPLTKLSAIYLSDNDFSKRPLLLGAKPGLIILEMSIINGLDPSFNLRDYPELASFEAWHVPALTTLDPTGCPKLLRLSVDVTNISSIDVSKNTSLLILNVSDTKVDKLDVTNNPYLTELYAQHYSSTNPQYKLTQIDLSKNPYLARLFLDGNNLTHIDLSHNPELVNVSLKANRLKGVDFSNNPKLYSVDISGNDMDFTTIPADPGTYGEYYYSQRPFAASRSYATGTVLDFSDRVNRPGSQTDAVLYNLKQSDPMNPVLLEKEYYTWDQGRMTLNADVGSPGDSVYVAFKNTALQDAVLTTQPFVIKAPGDMGQPTEMASMTFYPTLKTVSLAIGLRDASETNPRPFLVDFGDGKPVAFTATAPRQTTVNATGTRSGTVKVYLPEGEDLTSLSVTDQRLLKMSVTEARSLTWLTVENCQLPALSLTWNRCLSELNLKGNTLKTLDLTAPNGNYGKNILRSVDASSNDLTEIKFPETFVLSHLNLSGNKLPELSLSHASGLQSLDISDNLIAELNLQDAESLRRLNASGNALSEIAIPEYLPLESLDLSRNNFTLKTLPQPGSISATAYTYAPQNAWLLPDKAPSANLSANWLDVDGKTTAYAWHMAGDGSPVPEGAITDRGNGRFKFVNHDLGQVYCTMTHPVFPAMSGADALATTPVLVADKPDNAFATFTTTGAANAVLTLTGARNGTTVYVDWTGDDDFEQYILKDTYTQYPVSIDGAHTVTCYTYEPQDNITVFSLRNAPLKNIDLSSMQSLQSLIISGAGLGTTDSIKFPAQKSTITELSLDGNGLESVNLSQFPSLYSLSLNNNKLESLDVTGLKTLGVLYVSGNGMTTLTLDNPRMWELAALNNNFETLDLKGVPSMQQLWLSNNRLGSLDVSTLTGLRVLTLDGNRFTFNTLPAENSNYIIYNYTNQAPVEAVHADGIVDLSEHAVSPHGPATTYTWYIDSPYIDEYGDLTGEELYENEEYTLENGVTTFLKPFNHIMCVMKNTAHPSLNQYSNFVDVVAGVDRITADTPNDAPVEYYTLQGIRVNAADLIPGIYIRRQGNTSTKVRISRM